MESNKKEILFSGFAFAVLTTLLLGLLFFSYILGGGDSSFMDTKGWIYLFTSSLFHAGLIILAPYVVLFIPLTLLGMKKKWIHILTGILYIFLILLFFINRIVFQLYHFHINGFVLDMLFSEDAGDIFVFSFWMYAKALLFLLGVCLSVFMIYRLSAKIADKVVRRKRFYLWTLSVYGTMMLLSQGMHVYGAATLQTSILESDAYLPYYFPVSMNSALDKMGVIDKEKLPSVQMEDRVSQLSYPADTIRVDESLLPQGKRLNIVMILIDSWNFRTLTEECMPNVWAFKEQSEYYAAHLSSSNGTRGSIFGLFTGISSYYWKSFEYSSLRPVLVDQLIENGYHLLIHPSASFCNPPFDRVLFKGVDINTRTEGITTYEKDCQLTNDFLEELPSIQQDEQPTFAFLFYDVAHAITIPKDKNTRFKPAWDYPDYTVLNNNMDPTPYFNLYKNCIYQIDSLIGLVLNGLEQNGLLENTIVLISGDHSQEFNENRKNYWGHAGNYSKYQIQVPMILHYPGATGRTYHHRTTHYDVAPTLMRRAMGVTNPPSDYSMGAYLQDSTSRGWHLVGNDLDYAFITEDGHIIEKKGNGYVRIYDGNLNLVKDYRVPTRELNENLLKMNRFYK